MCVCLLSTVSRPHHWHPVNVTPTPLSGVVCVCGGRRVAVSLVLCVCVCVCVCARPRFGSVLKSTVFRVLGSERTLLSLPERAKVCLCLYVCFTAQHQDPVKR